jgi:hypothetical protein
MPRQEKGKRMATYKEIQEDIRQRHHVTVKTCWIDDIKRKHGQTRRIASNGLDPERAKYRSPHDKQRMIEESLKRFADL